jgi:Concanavalin A-like lectin/glucanases superfamily
MMSSNSSAVNVSRVQAVLLPKRSSLKVFWSFWACLMTLLLLTSSSIQAQTGEALNFDGTNDYVNCTNLAALNGTAKFTGEAWITTTVGTGNRMIMGKGDDFHIAIFGTNNIHCRVKNGTDAYGYTTSNPLASLNTWIHVACVYDGSLTGNANRLKIYINGTLQTLTFSGTIPATVATNTSTLKLGAYGLSTGTAQYWSGKIDEVRLWSVARTQTEIQTNRNTELCGSPTGLVAYYKFNQGTASGSNTALKCYDWLKRNLAQLCTHRRNIKLGVG